MARTLLGQSFLTSRTYILSVVTGRAKRIVKDPPSPSVFTLLLLTVNYKFKVTLQMTSTNLYPCTLTRYRYSVYIAPLLLCNCLVLLMDLIRKIDFSLLRTKVHSCCIRRMWQIKFDLVWFFALATVGPYIDRCVCLSKSGQIN
jgi:hypothetical protein